MTSKRDESEPKAKRPKDKKATLKDLDAKDEGVKGGANNIKIGNRSQ